VPPWVRTITMLAASRGKTGCAPGSAIAAAATAAVGDAVGDAVADEVERPTAIND
ncbi:MAG: hypothetical protein ACI8W3_002430, partial [Myxococcota bacterium]